MCLRLPTGRRRAQIYPSSTARVCWRWHSTTWSAESDRNFSISSTSSTDLKSVQQSTVPRGQTPPGYLLHRLPLSVQLRLLSSTSSSPLLRQQFVSSGLPPLNMDASPLKRVIPRELLLMTLDELSPQLISIDCNMCLIAKCTRRDDTGAATARLYRNIVKNIRALSALSRTCKELHELVTPLLYACPLAPTRQGEWLFARTLLTSPNLAQLVRILVPDHHGISDAHTKKEPPPEVTAFCLGVAKASTTRRGFQLNLGNPLELEDLVGRYNDYSIPVDITTSLCPNLEQLCILSLKWACFNPQILWADGTTFPKLTRVSINMHKAMDTFYECEYLPLLHQTPNVKSLHIVKCNAEERSLEQAMPGLVLHNLKFLELGIFHCGKERLDKIFT